MPEYHIPILLNEVLDFLEVGPNKTFVDCNLGGGGHTRGMLKRGGKVLGIDWDQEAIDYVSANNEEYLKNGQLVLRKGNFANLTELAASAGIDQVDGILFDLGVSSHQLDTDYRGFSFNKNGALDMRMDRELGVTAMDLVNAAGESELANIFYRYAQEHASRKIASAIVHFRKTKKIETTDELAKIVLSVSHRSGFDRNHPATRVFQALRIAVNDELTNLELVLPQALALLKSGGKMVVLTFHSGEDTMVKEFIRNGENEGLIQSLVKHVVRATDEEVENNPRARSAKLRAIVKK